MGETRFNGELRTESASRENSMLFPQRRGAATTGAYENHWRRKWEQSDGGFYGFPDSDMDILTNNYLQHCRDKGLVSMATNRTTMRMEYIDVAGTSAGLVSYSNQERMRHLAKTNSEAKHIAT